ncbi:MAG: AsmA family protein [Oligoflexia bacterium]|nr:AsmA family protein [Oligoflexia bacterium]
MKKLFVIFGGIVALLLIAALLVPLFVDVDKYRPQIVQEADRSINGKLELGKLSLSLWGQVRIDIEGLKLSDSEGRPVVQVKNVFFRIPFSSLLSGTPELVLRMQEPELNVVKDKKGRLNVLTLVKSSAPAAVPSPAPSAKAPAAREGEGGFTFPGIASRARLGVEFNHAQVAYQDEATGMKTNVKDLDMRLENLSLSQKTSLEISADLNTRLKGAHEGAGGLWVKGPAKITGTANPTVSAGRFERVDLVMHVDLDRLEIDLPGVLHKKPGIDAHADLTASISPMEAVISRLDLKFFNASIDSSGKISHLGEAEQPVIAYQAKSNSVELKPWVELVPMLKDYELGGTVNLAVEANGPANKLVYQGKAKVAGLTAKAPQLKSQPRINAEIDVVPDKADLKATMKAPGNDLSIAGDVVSFTHPQIRMSVNSPGMDLDQLIAFPAKAAPAAPPATATTGGAPHEGAGTDYDAMVAPLRENKAFALATAHLTVAIHSLKCKGITITDLNSKASLQSLIASIDSLELKVFGGQVKSSASVDLKPKMPDYHLKLAVAQLDLKQAVDSELQLFRNTVLGKANLDMSGTGKSLNAEPATRNLNAKGKLRVTDATFTTLDVSKMVVDGINGAIARIEDKVPLLKGKALPQKLPSGGSRYDSISTSFTIAQGAFNAPDFVAKASPNRGIDLKGSATVGLLDKSLRAHFDVIDTYNLTRARDIGNHLLADGNNPVHFPVDVSGTLSAPQYGYGAATESLVTIALKNTTRSAAQGLLKQAPPSVQNALKGLLGQ